MTFSNFFKSSAVQTHGRASQFANRASLSAIFLALWLIISATNLFAQTPLPQSGNLSGNYTAAGGTFTGPYTLTGNVTITCSGAGGSTVITGVISSGSTYTLSKTGTGDLELRGNNTYTGTTNLNGGNLYVGYNTTSGQISGNIVLATGTNLYFYRSNAYTHATDISGAGNVLQYGNGTTTLTGNVTITGNTYIINGTLSIGNNGTTGGITGIVSVNSGTTLRFYRSDDYTYSGFIIGVGAVTKMGSGTLIFTGSNDYSGGTTISAGTLQIGNNGTTGGITGNIVNNATLRFNRSNPYIFNGIISGTGNVVHDGQTISSILVLGGASTYSGNTYVYGPLSLSSGGSLENSIVMLQNNDRASLDVSAANTTIGGLGGSRATSWVDLGSTTLTINNGAATFAGIISGSGGITKLGTGAQAFTGANTYTGNTTISAGTIYLGNNTAGGSVVGNIINNAALIVNRTGNWTYSGVISGTGTFTKNGSGTLILTGANTYTGGTTITAGTLQIGNGGTTGQISNTGGVSNNAALIINRSNSYTYSGVISGTGTLTYAGTSTLYLTGNNTYAGNTTISAGTISIGNNATTGEIAGNIINNSFLRFYRSNAYTYNGVISGTGNVYQFGPGTVTLGGINTYTGITYIDAPLILSTNGSIANSSSVTFRNYAAAQLTINGNKTISELNSVSTVNPGSVSISGSNSLFIGNTGIADGTGTFHGAFTGAGSSVVKRGTGTFTLGGNAHTSTADFLCNQGEVILAGNWNNQIILSADATLTISENRTAAALNVANGGTMNFDLSAVTPSKLTTTGALMSNNSNPCTINISSVGAASSYPVITAASGITTNPFVLTGVSGSLSATATELTFTRTPDHIPVTDITGIPTTATATLPLTLTGTVVPSTATNQDIIWSVENAGTTGANITSGNILHATGAGTATIRATIVNGLTPSSPFIKDVAITVSLAELNGTVGITGNNVFGQTLTANTVGLSSTPVIPDLGTLSYQWQRGTTNISGAVASTYTLVQEDIGNTIRVVVTAANCSENVISSPTATILKASQTAPEAPTLNYSTAFSIVLNSVDGCEYNIDGGSWQTSPIFADLTPETTYSFKQRLAETPTHLASPESSAVTFTTDEVINPVYVITATAGANGEIDPSGDINVEEGDNQQFYFFPDSGYEIEQVLVDGTSVPEAVTDGFYIFENVTDNHTIHVTFAVKTFTITASAGANGSIEPSGTIYVDGGDNQQFTFMPDTGYEIDEVLVDGIPNYEAALSGFYNFENVTENHTIHVTFVIKNYVIVATAGEFGIISPDGNINVEHGSNQTFEFIPNFGYEIEQVLIDGSSNTQAVIDGYYTFQNVTENHTINVTFMPEEVETYTVTASAGENGSIDPSGEIVVEAGTNKQFFFYPVEDYEIAQVLVDGINDPDAVVNGTYIFVNITEDHTIHVTFKLISQEVETYTITASAGENGNIDPSGEIIVEEGDNQTFTFTPNANYQIEQVLIDGIENPEAVENGYHTFINVTENHTIHVTFGFVGIDVEMYGRTSPDVYPNPTSGVFFVRHCGLDPQSPQNNGMLKQVQHDAALEILDITGRIVHRALCTVHRATIEIDITHLANGVYFVKIDNETIKIVKN